MEKINLDVVLSDLETEIDECFFTSYFPDVIEKKSCYIALRNFRFDMVSTSFLKFLNAFCDDRNLNWFVNFENSSILIG